MTMPHSLRQVLQSDGLSIAPGIADTLSTVLAERAGFPAVFLSGSAMAYTHLARPDIGLLSLGEIADIVRRIRERTEIPLVVDADSGFGNAYQVHRSVRALEQAGASGVQIEDQLNDKHPTQVTQRPLVRLADMLDKIKAALDARRDDDFIVSARTDAAVAQQSSMAQERAAAFVDCGADAVFVEGLPDAETRQQLVAQIKDQVPLLYNLSWQPSGEPRPTLSQLATEGFSLALAPAAAINASMTAIANAFNQLSQDCGIASTSPPVSIAEAIDATPFISKYQQWSTRHE